MLLISGIHSFSFFTFICDIFDPIACFFQILVHVAITFIFTISTSYTFCQFVLQRDVITEGLSFVKLGWQMFYFGWNFIIVHFTSSLVKGVKSMLWKIYSIIKMWIQLWIVCLFTTGKNTLHVVHDIINWCDDSDLMVSVSSPNESKETFRCIS